MPAGCHPIWTWSVKWSSHTRVLCGQCESALFSRPKPSCACFVSEKNLTFFVFWFFVRLRLNFFNTGGYRNSTGVGWFDGVAELGHSAGSDGFCRARQAARRLAQTWTSHVARKTETQMWVRFWIFYANFKTFLGVVCRQVGLLLCVLPSSPPPP